jgi:UDP-glucuronate 4-epimerase
MPFSEHHGVNHPISLYAATKKANELMAHTYSHLFALPTTGLRFFTVYGPWGRPDMAMLIFARAILRGEPIRMFNHGNMRRDFTYIDDIVESIIRVLDRPPAGDATWSRENPDPATSSAPYRVYNIGNSSPVDLMVVIEELQRNLERPAILQMAEMQPGDVPATFADTSELESAVAFRPSTSIADGIERTMQWYTSFYDADGSPRMTTDALASIS